MLSSSPHRGVKEMAMYAVSIVLARGISLLALPLYAHYLTPADIGQLEILATTVVFIDIVAACSLNESLYRFVGTERNPKRQHKSASTIFTLTLLISFLISLLATALMASVTPLAIHQNSAQLVMLFIAVFIGPALLVSMSWLRMQNRATTFLKISVGCTAIQFVLIVLVLFNAPDITALFAVGVLTTVLQALSLQWVNRFQLCVPSLHQCRTYLRYSLPLMLATLVAFGLSGAEKWVIAASTSLAVLGQYAVAVKFGLAMCILMQPFGMWWMPKRFNLLEHAGPERATQITQYGLIYLAMVCIGVFSFAQLFIRYALPDVYLPATQLLMMVILTAAGKETFELLNIGLLHQKRTDRILHLNIISTAIALTIMSLSLWFGMWCVLWGLFIGQWLRALLACYYSQKTQALPYQLRSLVLFALITIGLISVTSPTTSTTVWWSLLIFGPLLVALMAYTLGLVTSDTFKRIREPIQSHIRG
ncbi:lipopolysaccharide biosynthesis protein [Vibrio proteolyticus]|uniref:Lipopolysaccharide biosynthesis protein n=1 Tax=Vibrio proteolyticus NBRC 13287 TaxID=1219065 RepID=U2ZCC8_VIBPR|nr:oligosaccharide flippase family protein [Vibrio proteolyticus]GAD65341.1 hypothetical protein VPR01S_01_01130 [Vibrio proteolyticus NBRC 13287]